jgi:hypothetical protein
MPILGFQYNFMKKIIISLWLLLSFVSTFAQVKKAALIFLETSVPQVTFYGCMPARDLNAPKVYFKNGPSFNDSILFAQLKNNLNNTLAQLNFQLIAEDSVINAESYKGMMKVSTNNKAPTERAAKGYVYVYASVFGIIDIKKYFEISPTPDVVIDAYASYQLNYTGKSLREPANNADLSCDVIIKAFNIKNKKVFKFSVTYKNPTKVLLKPSYISGWGFEVAQDISTLQWETLAGALKLIDAEIPEQKEKVAKFYSKN